MVGESAAAGGDVAGATAVNEGNDEVAQSGEDMRCIARADARAIFPEGHIADVVETILDAPMPPHEVESAAWTGLGGDEGGDEIDRLAPRHALDRDMTSEPRHLGDVW